MTAYDVIVLGLGAMGSATAFHGARRGRRILGLDAYEPGHTRGASHGRTRAIREAHFEAPEYVPLVQRAYALWRELEAASVARPRDRSRPHGSPLFRPAPPEYLCCPSSCPAGYLARSARSGSLILVEHPDGSAAQLARVEQTARREGVRLTVVLDVMHVAEYLWSAALAFHAEDSPDREVWVSERLLAVLEGRASLVAAGIRRSATRRELSATERKPVDVCARYLLTHKAYLQYHEYLAAGLPIATGVIEGAPI